MRKVLVIGMGGTACCVEGKNGLEPRLYVGELLERVRLPEGIEARSEQMFCLDSTNMTLRHWELLSSCICRHYSEFDGFVVTHGTDTMAYAAAALSVLIQNSRKPIALTGSMKAFDAEDSDAPVNLRDAVCFAADEGAFGVSVVFGGMCFYGDDVHKCHSEDTFAFKAMSRGLLGMFSDCGELLNFHASYSGETRFYERLSDEVFLAKLIPGQRLYVPENARAVILESYGAGGVPDYLFDDAKRLFDRGVYLIIATQCEYGGTDISKYAVGRTALNSFMLTESGRFTVEYAVARAQWALAYSDNCEEFKALFCTSEENES